MSIHRAVPFLFDFRHQDVLEPHDELLYEDISPEESTEGVPIPGAYGMAEAIRILYQRPTHGSR